MHRKSRASTQLQTIADPFVRQRSVLDVRAVSVEEAARIIGIGRTAVYELINSGKLVSIRVGRRRLIPVVEIDKFLESRLIVQNPAI